MRATFRSSLKVLGTIWGYRSPRGRKVYGGESVSFDIGVRRSCGEEVGNSRSAIKKAATNYV